MRGREVRGGGGERGREVRGGGGEGEGGERGRKERGGGGEGGEREVREVRSEEGENLGHY